MSKLNDIQAAQIAKALGDPNRLCVFTQISQNKELFCGEMHAKNEISPATLSHHLKVLAEAKLITSRREGQNVYYRTLTETVSSYREYLADITELAAKL
jgi:ArsR family transcriptional regulator